VEAEVERLVSEIESKEAYKGLFKKTIDPVSGLEKLQWDPDQNGILNCCDLL
jgi:hypothetical protein